MSEIIHTDMEAFLNAGLSFSESPKYNIIISPLSLANLLYNSSLHIQGKSGIPTTLILPLIIIVDVIQRLEEIKGIDVRIIESTMQTRMTILVVDKKYSLVVELKDDTKDDPKEAIGLATYSSSKSTVLSYVSIFDALWKQSELREELLIRSMAQKEFINIAAHELRNPIQPLLGLSDFLLRSGRVLTPNSHRGVNLVVYSVSNIKYLLLYFLKDANIFILASI